MPPNPFVERRTVLSASNNQTCLSGVPTLTHPDGTAEEEGRWWRIAGLPWLDDDRLDGKRRVLIMHQCIHCDLPLR